MVPPTKRQHLADQLLQLGLETNNISKIKKRRYSHLTTLTADQLCQISDKELRQVLKTAQQSIDMTNRKNGDTITNATNTTKNGDGYAQPSATIEQFGGRYEQFRRRKGGATLFQQTEGAAIDPLSYIADTLYDVMYHDDDNSSQNKKKAKISKQEQEDLDTKFLPLLREVLHEQQQERDGEDGEVVDNNDNDNDNTIEYVYDLYAEVAQSDAASKNDDEEAAYWAELAASGTAPVVSILHDDEWLVMEADDGDDSCEDGSDEDSNAEGYYANDYPDEDWGCSTDDDDAEGGGECYSWRQRGRGGGGGGGVGWSSDGSYGPEDGEY
jgi:hypothetical protein